MSIRPISSGLFEDYQLFPEIDAIVDPSESLFFAELETRADPEEDRLFAELENGFSGLSIDDDSFELNDFPMRDASSKQALKPLKPLDPNRVMPHCDRDIPSRAAMNKRGSIQTHHIPAPKTNYQKALAETLFPHYSEKTLQFTAPKKCDFEYKKSTFSVAKYPVKPYTTVSFNGFRDDYYTNNIDWGKRFLAINVGLVCAIWDTTKKEFLPPLDIYSEKCSVKCSPSGSKVAIGDFQSRVCVFKPGAGELFVAKNPHTTSPVLASAWKSEIEFTTSWDCNLHHYDLRSKKISKFIPCSFEQMCGLEWSPDSSLLARGGDDNAVQIFDARRLDNPLFTYYHLGGVKALKWIPNSSLLVSGGGHKDRMMKVFNAATGAQVCEANVGAQVCSIEHLSGGELVLGTGHNSNNIQFWNFDREERKLSKRHELPMMTSRVFNISKKPNHMEFSAICGDGRLSFWEIKSDRREPSSESKLKGITLR